MIGRDKRVSRTVAIFKVIRDIEIQSRLWGRRMKGRHPQGTDTIHWDLLLRTDRAYSFEESRTLDNEGNTLNVKKIDLKTWHPGEDLKTGGAEAATAWRLK
jgi:hypothetical protein